MRFKIGMIESQIDTFNITNFFASCITFAFLRTINSQVIRSRLLAIYLDHNIPFMYEFYIYPRGCGIDTSQGKLYSIAIGH